LGVREFPAMVLGPIFSGFSNCIFTEYKDFIILASDLSTLQEYLLVLVEMKFGRVVVVISHY
jgi:hypothetical protein